MPETTLAAADVLVVDDDEAVRDSLTILLETEGIAAASLESGDRLLARLADIRAPVILLDIRMPGTGGLEVLKQLADSAPDKAVVMITGHGDVPMAVRAMQLGAVNFVEKPFVDGRIVDAVRDAQLRAAARRDSNEATERASALLERLTPREFQIMQLVVSGLATKQVASKLGISPRTVEIHRQRIMRKTEAHSLAHLVHLALAAGISQDD